MHLLDCKTPLPLAQRLAQIRIALDAPPPEVPETQEEAGRFDGYPCPKCRQGHLHVARRLAPQRHPTPGEPST